MAMTLITTNTESGDANSAFTSSIDSTYKLYVFKFYDVNPATNSASLTFNGSTDSGSNFNVTKTTTYFEAYHHESTDSDAALSYQDGSDVAQGTGYTQLARGVGNGSDESASGTLWLFNPSNTTYVKHFYCTTQFYFPPYSMNAYSAGYFNTTSAIDAVDFKMSSGNMDGVIKMYGVS